MRLVMCWADISGYMAACWRALSSTPDVDLRIIATRPGGKSFSDDLVAGLNIRLLSRQEKDDPALIASIVKEHRPDVLYTSGWNHEPYRRLVSDPAMASVPKWMGVDTPWRGTFRQQLARIALRRYVARMDRVFVPGERAFQYVRLLGVPEGRIRRGLYGVDYAALAPLHEQRAQRPEGWPRRFLYVGRYAPEKDIPTLVAGYREYRRSVGEESAWPLTCCGSGPLQDLLRGESGIEDRGFVAPPDLPAVMVQHGAFVIASSFDPWPLVVVESCAAGLPVICTESCGSAVELVRPYYNGLTVATADAAALARAMRWSHEQVGELPEMGRCAREMAAAYSAQAWATRWAAALRESVRA
jgi:glycosyltransferase involved in cell wall biosynthesis